MNAFVEKFSKKNVKGKMTFMSRFFIAAMLVMGVIAVIGAFELHVTTKELAEEWMVANNIISDLDYYTSEVRLKQYHHLIADTDAEFREVEEALEDVFAEIDALLVQYEATIETDTDREYYNKAVAAWNKYLDVTGDEFMALSRALQLKQANEIMVGEAYTAFSEFQVYFDTLLEFNLEGADSAASRAEIAYFVVLGTVIVLTLAAAFIGLRVAKMTIESITNPIAELVHVAEEMTEGNLHVKVN